MKWQYAKNTALDACSSKCELKTGDVTTLGSLLKIQSPLKTCQIRTCILTRSLGELQESQHWVLSGCELLA
jgi:hypothetical protein